MKGVSREYMSVHGALATSLPAGARSERKERAPRVLGARGSGEEASSPIVFAAADTADGGHTRSAEHHRRRSQRALLLLLELEAEVLGGTCVFRCRWS